MEFYIIRVYEPKEGSVDQVSYHSGAGGNRTTLEGAKIYGSWRRVKQAWSLHKHDFFKWGRRAEIVKFTCYDQGVICDHNLTRSA